MTRFTRACIVTVLIGHGALYAAQNAAAAADAEQFGTVVSQYCVTCHNDALLTAGLSLQRADVRRIGEGSATWEKVLRKIKVMSMPPSGVPRPDVGTYAAFANFLETELDRYAEQHPRPGAASLRRLNRTEYFNA
ncbi:MAG: hypothetical protein OER85_19080, partial [Gammaproteobacteria bacterium]|nr:hypothetical protein [Gammaproteobacteria bacterium]